MLGGGVRKAYASLGDDVTLSRFVKVPASEEDQTGVTKRGRKSGQMWLPGTRFDISQTGRSLFYRKGSRPLTTPRW